MQHSSIPHRLQVLAVWAIASLIGLLIFNLGGLDTPQTYWSAAKPSYLQHVAFGILSGTTAWPPRAIPTPPACRLVKMAAWVRTPGRLCPSMPI